MGAAIALAAVTLAAAAGTGRLFVDPVDGALPAVAAALYTHLQIQVAATLRWRSVASAATLLGGLFLVAAWTVTPEATSYGVPTPATLEALLGGFRTGMAALRTAVLPVGTGSGLEIPALAAATLVAIGSDRFAFGHGRPVVALVPALGLFAVGSALGDDRGQTGLVVAFVAAVCLFLILFGPLRRAGRGWTGTARRAGLSAGIPLLALGVLAAPLLGPRLPWATAAGLVELGERTPPVGRDRVTVSPLVGIRDLLVADSPTEVFTVASPVPAYWRLAALETFDGNSWATNAGYRPARGTLPADATGFTTETVTQNFAISNLSQFWLPAAYRPVSVDLVGARVNEDSLSLITDAPTAVGLSYTVKSEVPRYSYSKLRQGGQRVPASMAPFLTLPPGGVPADVARLAEEVTREGTTPYGKALLLQNFFRTEFEYDTSVPAGHSQEYMSHFLLQDRRGYCEQFASSFVLMARWLRIPARVAVGFTPGTWDPAIRGYRVTTAEAHAWPEVYLDPFGWVALEPTPGRFEPSPADHTGTYDAELYARHVEAGGTLPPAPGSYEGRRVVIEDLPPTTSVQGGEGGSAGASPSREEVARNRALNSVRVAFGVAVLLSVVVVLNIVAVRRLRSQRRRRQPPRVSIATAWEGVTAELAVRRVSLSPADTPRQVLERAADEEPAPVHDDLTGLAGLVETAVYGADEPGVTDVEEAWRRHDAVVRALRRDGSFRARAHRMTRRPMKDVRV